MNVIYTTYNIHHNSIDVYTYAGYFLRIDCNKAEDGLQTTPCSECALNVLAVFPTFSFKIFLFKIVSYSFMLIYV